MKIFIVLLLNIFLPFLKNNQSVTNKVEVPCSSYIVMNRLTNEVLSGKNIDLQRSVASISKIMTAIIALESDRLFDIITIDEEATRQEGSSLYLKKEEQISLIDLVYGLMLRSGNDAAYSIATYLSGDVIKFKDRMNAKAQELKMFNSRFNNPSGLDIDDEGNISTAYDMAILFPTP